jgi:hypothetical protein
MFTDWVCWFWMCDAEEVPSAVRSFDEGVIVEIPRFRFADGWVVELYEVSACAFVWEWLCYELLVKKSILFYDDAYLESDPCIGEVD